MPLPRIIQSLVRRLTGSRPPVTVFPKPGVLLAPVAAWALSGGTTAPPTPALKRVQDRMSDVAASLAGERRTTSFRHELVDMDAGELVKKISSSRRAQAIVHHLAATFQPQRTLELGSAFGSATMAMASALTPTPQTRLDGIELDPWRAGIAHTNVQSVLGDQAAVHAGSIDTLLPQLVATHGRAQLVFVDAVHRYAETWAYHLAMLTSTHPNAVVIYDDVDWSPDMTRCWNDITAAPEVHEALLLHNRWGIAIYR